MKERFWRTFKEDLLCETDFDELEELKEEVMQYMCYYNHERPHQGIDRQKTDDIAEAANKKDVL